MELEMLEESDGQHSQVTDDSAAQLADRLSMIGLDGNIDSEKVRPRSPMAEQVCHPDASGL